MAVILIIDTYNMNRTGRCLQSMEGNGIVHSNVTKTGPPTSDTHLHRPTRLRNTNQSSTHHSRLKRDSFIKLNYSFNADPENKSEEFLYQHRESLGERAFLQQRGELVELIRSVSPLLYQVHSMEDKLGGHVTGVRC